MTKTHVLRPLLGILVPLVFLNVGQLNANLGTTNLNNEINLDLAKVTPHQSKYTHNDFIDAEHAFTYWSKNYRFSGLSNHFDDNYIYDNYRGEGVTVAVIDTGLDIFHEEFLSKEAKGKLINIDNVKDYSLVDPQSAHIYSAIDENGDVTYKVDVGLEYIYDTDTYSPSWHRYSSHGTGSAGIISSAINGLGGFGIAPNVNLLFIKTDLTNISCVESIRYAYQHGADIISMSFGAYNESFTAPNGTEIEAQAGESTLFKEVVKEAWDNGTICVASAGNDRVGIKSYPASNDYVIGVGALEYKNGIEPANYTNFNLDTDTPETGNNVDVTASSYVMIPNIMQDRERGLDELLPPTSTYEQTMGTSLSAPLVAGALALYKSKYPSSTPQQIQDALFGSCIDIGEPGWDKMFGHGRLDIMRLLNNDYPLDHIEIEKGITLTGTLENPHPTYIPKLNYFPNNAGDSTKRGTWSTSDPSIVTIDKKSGMIGAMKSGTATITFTTDLGKITDSVEVRVENVEQITEPLVLEYNPNTLWRLKIDDRIHNIHIKGNGPVLYHAEDETGLKVNEIGNLQGIVNSRNRLHFSLGDQYGFNDFSVADMNNQCNALELRTVDGKPLDLIFGEEFPYYNIEGIASYNAHPYKEIVNVSIYDYAEMQQIGSHNFTCYYRDFGDEDVTGDIVYTVTNKGSKQTKKEIGAFDSYTMASYDNYFGLDGYNQMQIRDVGLSNWYLNTDNDGQYNMSWDEVNYVNVIGTSEKHPSTITISTSDLKFYMVNQIRLDIYAVGAEISVIVGDKVYQYNGQNSALGTAYDSSYLFAGDATYGEIKIIISNIKDAVYFSGITVYGPKQVINNFEHEKQAQSLFNWLYFIPSCAADWDDATRDEVVYVINEFNYMVQESKDHAILKDKFIDKGDYETTAIEKLKMIVSQYNKTLKEGEDKLELVLNNDPSALAKPTYDGLNEHYYYLDILSLIIMVSVGLVIAGVSTVIIIKKRND